MQESLEVIPAVLPLSNDYARLPGELFARVAPTSALEPRLVELNEGLALSFGLDPSELRTLPGVELLSGRCSTAGGSPLAMAYAGHQFGRFVPRLGDGRAVLLGELRDADGVLFDLHLKGAGRTPFSRGGDGRAGLGPVLREYVVSEAMAALGIPTTRALAMFTTGDRIERQQGLEPGASLLRVARSHLRVGTFEYAARISLQRGSEGVLRTLADYTVERLVPQAREAPQPYRALLEFVVERQAELVAHWMCVGFIHGVMNTDNAALSGETLDFGPCAFMDHFDPQRVFSSIDHAGRYAYDRQPGIAHWNLARFAETLLPLLSSDRTEAVELATAVLSAYPERYERCHSRQLYRKLGLRDPRAGDPGLIQELFDLMAASEADFTHTFRELSNLGENAPDRVAPLRLQFSEPERFDAWLLAWRQRSAAEGGDDLQRGRAMRSVNPIYIPRNHCVQNAIEALVDRSDRGPLDRLLAATSSPFDERCEYADLARPPEPHEVVRQTFCGT